MHALVAAILVRLPGRDALDVNAEPQPPDGELAEPIERCRRGKRQPVVRANRERSPEVFEGAFEDSECEGRLRRGERVTGPSTDSSSDCRA